MKLICYWSSPRELEVSVKQLEGKCGMQCESGNRPCLFCPYAYHTLPGNALRRMPCDFRMDIKHLLFLLLLLWRMCVCVCGCFLFLGEKHYVFSFDPACSKPLKFWICIQNFPSKSDVEMGTRFGKLGRVCTGEVWVWSSPARSRFTTKEDTR